MLLINLMYDDRSCDEIHLQQLLCERTPWPEEAVTDAVKAYMQTEGLPFMLSKEGFSWGDVRSEIPDEFWKSQGFTPLSLCTTVTITDFYDFVVDELDDVDAALVQAMQEQAERAVVETNLMAIQTPEDLVSKLEAAGYSKEHAEMVVELLQGDVDPCCIADVEDWARQCYTTPSDDELLTQALNAVLDMHGVFETSSPVCGEDPDLTYLEAGDTYNLTMVKYEGDWYCASLGDVIESIGAQRAIPGKIALTSQETEINLDAAPADAAPSIA